MNPVDAVGLVFMGVVLGVMIGAAIWFKPPSLALELESFRQTEPTYATEETEEIEPFTVAGKPRKPSWKQRRKELEAKARTKRHAIEEWRD